MKALAYGIAAILVALIGVQVVRTVGPSIRRERASRVAAACVPLEPTAFNAALGRFPRPAPDIQAQDYTGKMVPLSAYRGKVVFLNFWASWCPPCVKEMPSMEVLQQRFGGGDFVILAVSSDEDWKKIGEFFPNGTSMTVLWDPSASGGKAGGVAKSYGTEKLIIPLA